MENALNQDAQIANGRAVGSSDWLGQTEISETVERFRKHISMLGPTQKARRTAQLLIEATDLIDAAEQIIKKAISAKHRDLVLVDTTGTGSIERIAYCDAAAMVQAMYGNTDMLDQLASGKCGCVSVKKGMLATRLFDAKPVGELFWPNGIAERHDKNTKP